MALIAGGLVLALELWTVVPAPNIPTLGSATVVPELTPWVAGCCLLGGAIAQIVARGWARTVGVSAAAVALGLALIPWCLLPPIIAACNAEVRQEAGPRRLGLPPTLLIGGGRDELVPLAFQNELRHRLRRNGDRVAARSLPWSNHAFDTIPSGTAGQLARYYTQRFLAVTL